MWFYFLFKEQTDLGKRNHHLLILFLSFPEKLGSSTFQLAGPSCSSDLLDEQDEMADQSAFAIKTQKCGINKQLVKTVKC